MDIGAVPAASTGLWKAAAQRPLASTLQRVAAGAHRMSAVKKPRIAGQAGTESGGHSWRINSGHSAGSTQHGPMGTNYPSFLMF
jgi:hypothetical protein